MAALAQQSRNALLPALRMPLAYSILSSGFIPTFLVAPRLSWSIPSLQSLVELFPPFLLAVPKSKISHSRKSMRSANKGLKDKHNIVNCPGCGSPKLAHNLCPNCYTFLSRLWKSKRKQDGGGEIPDFS
ncbi:hypothetical protein BDZ94DRAFT_1177863 [Collybia nuda]|uniref:Large ribosomal subunit protein bL32m n=1 Tax=Collybia nuda TaxID=64659 RepID=A0A9P5XQS0_9AGAR|nr:hypothetical protein BDZ94DRAFT_1179084 [Collybia nuda]KAF9456370.1 hypothetical protein BDZ94DRAFT_1177863 [Collybia nuda]